MVSWGSAGVVLQHTLGKGYFKCICNIYLTLFKMAWTELWVLKKRLFSVCPSQLFDVEMTKEEQTKLEKKTSAMYKVKCVLLWKTWICAKSYPLAIRGADTKTIYNI